MNLCQMVYVIENNSNVVVLMTKENMRLALASLRGFDGTECIIRVTKGHSPKISIYSRAHSVVRMDCGDASTSKRNEAVKKAVIECLEVDFGIHIGSDSELIEATRNIHKLDLQSARLRREKVSLSEFHSGAV